MTTKGTKFKDNLPDRPSEMIRAALRDLRAIEKNENYVVDMSTWHEQITVYDRLGQAKTICSVCLAGAVMAQTIGLEYEADYMRITREFDVTLDKKIDALNQFRHGSVSYAMNFLSLLDENNRELLESLDREVTDYGSDPEKFHAEVELVAADLEKLGY